jgi:cytochrome c5
MSEAQHKSDSRGGPVGLSSSQIFLACAAALVVSVVAAMMLGKGPAKSAAGNDGEVEAANARIQPVGAVTIKLEGGPLKTGEEVFKAQCSACHSAGLAGAPKFGDAGAWGPRVGAGYAALLNSALKGKGNMGAQGGGDFSDLEIGRAVAYMANAGGAKFEEPKAPDAAASK